MPESTLIGWLIGAFGSLLFLFAATLAYLWRRKDQRLDDHGKRIGSIEKNVATRGDIEGLRSDMQKQHEHVMGAVANVHKRIDGWVNGRVRQG